MKTSDLKFGDVVCIAGKLRREFKDTRPYRKEWVRKALPKRKTGILIGLRTLVNGTVFYGDLENPTIFTPTDHFRAALVATDLKTKPVLVALEDVYNDLEKLPREKKP